MTTENQDAWSWIDGKVSTNRPDADSLELSRSFARVFSHSESARVLDHLRKSTRDRVFGPEVSEATLRYVEGQRALVAYMENIIERGRSSAMQTGQ
ncbi:MAG: hypothetical protein HON65_10910 [Rhodospirillales bacterium]|jgi:hypothetical protein|nr:hypothetical protein [Rhodospirillales bacterium]